MTHRAHFLAVLLALTVGHPALPGQTVAVRRQEGSLHGFLALSRLDGTLLAAGDLTQRVERDLIASEIAFHFKDGSLHHETTTFSQNGVFRMVSHHLVQRGPSFPRTLDVRIDRVAGVTVRYTDADGKSATTTTQMNLPAGLANGMILTLLKNIPAGTTAPAFPLLAVTPAPRLVSLEATAAGEDTFAVGGSSRKALHYVVRVHIGGVAGWLAPLLGKQPPDSHVWILQGSVPAFVKAEEPLYVGGPVWRIELTSPEWPREAAGRASADMLQRAASGGT